MSPKGIARQADRTDDMLSAVTSVLDARGAHRDSRRPSSDDLIVAARHRIRERGYVGCSLRELADDVGVTPSVILRRFGSKYGLLQAIYESGYETALGWLSRAAPSGHSDPFHALTRSAQSLLHGAEAEPEIRDFLIANSGNTDFLLEPRDRATRDSAPAKFESQFFDHFLSLVSRAMSRGYAPGLEPVAVTDAVIGILERFMLNAYLHERSGGRYPYRVAPDAVEPILRMIFVPHGGALDWQSPEWPEGFVQADRSSLWGDTSRDRLLAAAWVEFVSLGYAGSTTRQIARAAHTSESELFRQYPGGKFDLLKAIYDVCYTVILGDLARIDTPDPRHALSLGARRIFELYDGQPSLTKFVIFNSGNADSLLIAPRDHIPQSGDQTALTDQTDLYFRWFHVRAEDVLRGTSGVRHADVLAQAVLGIVERALLSHYRMQEARSSVDLPSPMVSARVLDRLLANAQVVLAGPPIRPSQ